MTTTIKIKGMSCNHCVKAVSSVLKDVPGVDRVDVDLNSGIASLDHSGNLDMNVVRECIQKAGYELV